MNRSRLGTLQIPVMDSLAVWLDAHDHSRAGSELILWAMKIVKQFLYDDVWEITSTAEIDFHCQSVCFDFILKASRNVT